MKKKQILVIGKHQQIMETILRLINAKSRLNGNIAYSVDEALTASKTKDFDMVLIGAGLTDSETQQLRASFDVPVIQHYGGGSGLLFTEISQALALNIID